MKTFKNDKNSILDVTINVDDKILENALREFEKVKYSSVDTDQRPSKNDLENELIKLLIGDIEESLEEYDEAYSVEIGYTDYDRDINRFIKFILETNNIENDKFAISIEDIRIFTEPV